MRRLALAGAWWLAAAAVAQEATLPPDAEEGFRCVMHLAETGALGADVRDASIAVNGAEARVELLRRDAPAAVLVLTPARQGRAASRYFAIAPSGDASPGHAARLAAALDACFAGDPYQFAGLEESLAERPVPGIGAAWRTGGWRGVARALERRMMGLATRAHAMAIVIAVATGLGAGVLALWCSARGEDG